MLRFLPGYAATHSPNVCKCGRACDGGICDPCLDRLIDGSLRPFGRDKTPEARPTGGIVRVSDALRKAGVPVA